MEPDAISFSRDGGTYFLPLEVAIQSRGASAIYFTTDGSMPNRSSARYYSPITLDKTTRLKAIALDSDGDVARQASVDFIIPKDTSAYPYLDVASGMIYHVSSAYEYSLDDGSTWQPCTDPVQKVTISVGDSVWVRHRVVASDLHFLGTVDALEGYDLRAGQAYGSMIVESGAKLMEHDAVVFDSNLFDDGEAFIAIPTIENMGNDSFTGSLQLNFYASKDHQITEDDIRFLQIETNEFTLESNGVLGKSADDFFIDASWMLGKIKPIEGTSYPDLQYIVSKLVGDYHIGYQISVITDDVESSVELNSQNNWTLPQYTDTIYFMDPEESGTDLSGAFNVVNSYGLHSKSEAVPDGHYWIPFDAAIELGLEIFYTSNGTETPYVPTILARFAVEHENRAECLISIGVGDPDNPIAEKMLQSVKGLAPITVSAGGAANPFPNHAIVMDISEFAPYLSSNPLFMRVDNTNSDLDAKLNHFSIEMHHAYSLSRPEDPEASIEYDLSTTDIPEGEEQTFSINPGSKWDSLAWSVIQPNHRGASASGALEESAFTEEEITSLMERYTMDSPASKRSLSRKNDAISVVRGGLLPPSEAELRSMVTLRSVDLPYDGKLPEVLDLSATQYFPPIGNQGAKGSCVAFTEAYYIHTYNMAREHGWDLSGATWESFPYDDPDYPGYPSEANWDKIMSPDFVYHQATDQKTAGSTHFVAISLLDRIGCSSWATMPYDPIDDVEQSYDYPWPSELAFREAAQYRSIRPSASYFEDTAAGYFVLDSPEKVRLLKRLLASGYCVSTSIDALLFFRNTDASWLDEHDVVDLTGANSDDITNHHNTTNHAQTIVGYKAGAAWDPDNP
jgi:hypothetical protein